MRTVIHILAVLLVLAGGVFATQWIWENRPNPAVKPPEKVAPRVRLITARAAPVSLTVHAHGTVRPSTEIELVPEVSGRVVEVSPALAPGGFFERGQVLARLDPRDFEYAVTGAEAEVQRAATQLTWERAEAASARDEWQALGLDGTPDPLVTREPQVAQAAAMLAATEAARDQAELNLQRTELRAPFAGRVRSERVDVGQFVVAGAPIADLYGIDYAEVRLPLPDEELAFLELPLDQRAGRLAEAGPEVVVTAQFAGTEHRWRGRVVRIEGEIDPATRMVHAVARVDDPYAQEREREGPPLAAGMFVRAAIRGREIGSAVALPRSALHEGDRVLVVDDQSRLSRRKVQVLRRERERIVLRSGLRDGERVCVTPIDIVVDGMTVVVEPDDTAAGQPR
ncbi:MAG: efflux RND transporter periplasmic adaptor subunit [Planctomycetota bacterium]